MTLDEAIAAVRAAPGQSEPWYALGRLMAREGHADRARDCFTRAVALDPDAHKPGARPIPLPAALPPWLDQFPLSNLERGAGG